MDVADVQREFDGNVAGLLLASDEAEQDAIVGEAYEATAQGEDPINELADARERFVAQLRHSRRAATRCPRSRTSSPS